MKFDKFDGFVDGVERFHTEDIEFQKPHALEIGELVSTNILFALPFYCAKLLCVVRKNDKRGRVNAELLNNTAKIGCQVTKVGVDNITSAIGGIFGTIVSLSDEVVILKIANNVEIEVARSAINGVDDGKNAAT